MKQGRWPQRVPSGCRGRPTARARWARWAPKTFGASAKPGDAAVAEVTSLLGLPGHSHYPRGGRPALENERARRQAMARAARRWALLSAGCRARCRAGLS